MIMEQTELFQSPFTGITKPKKKRETSELTKMKHEMYEQYKINMKLYGREKEIEPYRVWLKGVNNAKI